MIKALLAPSEVALAKALGSSAIVSSLPEEKGADILLYTMQGLFGIQRKGIPHDFISSIEDGRMARSTSLLTQHCQFRLLLCEGRFRYYPDGKLDMGARVPTRYSYRQIHGMLFDIRYVKGVEIDYTEDIHDTAGYILGLAEFFSKQKHLGLYTRPSVKGSWGAPTAKDVDLWLLQSFQGIGVATAEKIIEHCGGGVPLSWTCTYEELLRVPGLSAKRAKMLWEALPLSGPLPVRPASVFDEIRRRLGKAKEIE